jgi:type VI secretion system secreted protein VgrG
VLLSLAARAGLTATAGLDLQLAAGEGITTTSGQDTHWGSGGATRIHTGQAIGMLAGAEKPGTQAAGKGFTLISAEGPIDIQAQNDTLQIAAEHDLLMESEHGHLDFASPKRISLTTGGGANITIEGGNITVQCPGTITVLAGHKSFVAPGVVNYALPQMPAQPCISCLLNALRAGSALALV